MSSVIITGGDQKEKLEEAKRLAGQASTGVDLVVFENPKGIEEVRQVTATVSRKPYQSKSISVILTSAEELSLEAQNALLKTLEEPPGNAQIFLLTNHPQKLLPTVTSRCQIIYLGPSYEAISAKDLSETWRKYQEENLSALFDRAAEEDPESWAELVRQLLLYKLGGEALLAKSSPQAARLTSVSDQKQLDSLTSAISLTELKEFLAASQQAKLDLDSNVNHRLVLENLYLTLPRPKNVNL
jgi:DNA polymerase III gamma/tau subunit